MADNAPVTEDIIEALGISRPAFEEIQKILGHLPSIEEISTLLAMWGSSGRQQSLYSWLHGQEHSIELNDYLYDGSCSDFKKIKEPRINECLEIISKLGKVPLNKKAFIQKGELIYMIGNVSSEFANSEYAMQYLHLVDQPITMESDQETADYIEMILSCLIQNNVITQQFEIKKGGLFSSLVSICKESVGFEILTCREIRLDSFLFGEEPGRFVVSLPEKQDDFFLQKMTEARINCCFLGRGTKKRVIVDGYDFGEITQFQEK